jgi:hypothetical protein
MLQWEKEDNKYILCYLTMLFQRQGLSSIECNCELQERNGCCLFTVAIA